MKQDSLLSNLSNLSYQENNQNIDFFNESSIIQTYQQNNVKQNVQQQQVDLNQLPVFGQNQPQSPKRVGHLLSAYWTEHNYFLAESFQIGQSHIGDAQQQLQILEEPKPKILPLIPQVIKPTINNQNIIHKILVKLQPQPQKMPDSEGQDAYQHISNVIKNQTKNIPKNYGKAIITYIEKQRDKFGPFLNSNGIDYQDLLSQLSKKKKYINTIANLRELWVDFKYSKCMRVLSNQFLRKYALQYIFNSRICNYASHIKYRKRLQEAIEAPMTFRHIKQY